MKIFSKARTGYSSNDIYRFLLPKGRVLDIGCGEGRHATYLKQEGISVIGTDVSIGLLSKVSPDIERVQGDGCHLPFESNIFDSVLCSEVLEHLVTPDECLDEIYRVLKNWGTACFTTPCLNIPIKILVPIYRKLARLDIEHIRKEHLHVFSTKDLLRMLSKSNFEIVSIKYVKFFCIPERSLGISFNKLDSILSNISSKIPSHYFAAGVWIKVRVNKA